MTSQGLSRSGPALIITALILFHLVIGLVWFSKAQCPLGVFDLERGGEYAGAVKALFAGDRGFKLLGALGQNDYFPPAYEIGLGLVQLAIGPRPESALLLNVLLLAAGTWGMYAMGSRLGGRTTGVLAAACLGLVPSISLGLRVASKEMGIALWTPLFLAFVARSERLSKLRPTLAAAASFGVGMLIKWNFAIAAAPAALAWIAFDRRQPEDWAEPVPARARLVNLCLAAILAFAITAPWYLGALDWQEIRVHTTIDPTRLDAGGQWNYYLENLLTHHLLLPGAIAVIACGLASLISRPRAALPVLAWIVVPYAVLSILPHKESRYFLPLLPAMALLVALGVGALPEGALRPAMAALVVVVGAFQAAWISFGRPMLVTDSAGLVRVQDLSCLAASRRAVEWLERTVPGSPNKGLTIVLHPLTRDDVFLGHHALEYWLRLSGRDQGGPWRADLWDFNRYPDLLIRFPEIDMLLVPLHLYDMKPWEIESVYSDLAAAFPDLAGKMDKQDPAMLGRIESEMRRVAEFSVPCSSDQERDREGFILYERAAQTPDN